MPADTHGTFFVDPPLSTESLIWLDSALQSDHVFVELDPDDKCLWQVSDDTINFPPEELFDSNKDIKWLIYMMIEYLIPWGHKVSGTIEWNNFYANDYGKVLISDNLITLYKGTVSYTPEITKDLSELV